MIVGNLTVPTQILIGLVNVMALGKLSDGKDETAAVICIGLFSTFEVYNFSSATSVIQFFSRTGSFITVWVVFGGFALLAYGIDNGLHNKVHRAIPISLPWSTLHRIPIRSIAGTVAGQLRGFGVFIAGIPVSVISAIKSNPDRIDSPTSEKVSTETDYEFTDASSDDEIIDVSFTVEEQDAQSPVSQKETRTNSATVTTDANEY